MRNKPAKQELFLNINSHNCHYRNCQLAPIKTISTSGVKRLFIRLGVSPDYREDIILFKHNPLNLQLIFILTRPLSRNNIQTYAAFAYQSHREHAYPNRVYLTLAS
ncbi:MAG TPA: hypothetical protein VKR58_08995, partial [Aquella sp.]|nr:hypothetical protein [Aquella sp.]